MGAMPCGVSPGSRRHGRRLEAGHWDVQVFGTESSLTGGLGQAGTVRSDRLNWAAGPAVIAVRGDAVVRRTCTEPLTGTQEKGTTRAHDRDTSQKEQARQRQAPSGPACGGPCVWAHTHVAVDFVLALPQWFAPLWSCAKCLSC